MNDDLLEQFLIEGRELTAQAAEDLAALALAPGDRARLDRCFRAVHTLKGSVGLFDLPAMGRLLHVAEDRLSALRQGEAVGESGLSRLVEVIDQTDRWLDVLARDGALPADAVETGEALIARLTPAAQAMAKGEDAVAIRYVPRQDAYFAGEDPIAVIRGVPRLEDLKLALREPPGDLDVYDPFQCNLVLEGVARAKLSEVEAALGWVKDQVVLSPIKNASAVPAAAAEGDAHARTIRVEATRVDRLADLASDLVIAKTGLADLVGEIAALEGAGAIARRLRERQVRIDRLVADLHDAVGKVRLTPLAPLLGRFPRLVRETARALGKGVEFSWDGGETEVDKVIVDGLFEPLLHVLRNALDHGLETPATRRSVGKREVGSLRLVARALGDQVIFEVSDDGSGIDPVHIRRAATARGLIDEVAADALDDRRAIDLIFLPGFSTAGAVTAVSGRGVGMDAVSAAITRLGGRVEIETAVGAGTTVRFLLPIRLVLTRILVVSCGDERYGLMLDDVVEMARVSADRIEPVRGGEAFQLRDQVLPLARLADLVGMEDVVDPTAPRRVVVARVAGERVGLSVDAVAGRMEAVIEPMGGLLAGARGLSGSTLLADGTVLMILDLAELLA